MRFCPVQGEKTQERSLDEQNKQREEGHICLLYPSLALPLGHLLICRAEWQMLLCHHITVPPG